MNFKFLTYNLWYSKNWEDEINFLQKQNADIFTLQEVTRNLPKFGLDNVDVYDKLKTSFPSHYGIFAPITYKVENGKEIAFGNAIFSKFPIISSQIHYYLKPLDWTDNYENQSRNLIEISVKINTKVFHIFTTHLTYSPGFVDTVNKIKEAKKIIALLKGKGPLIFSGDLNSHPRTEVIKLLSKAVPYLDQEENKPTWTKQPFSYKGFSETELKWKLDYVFTSKELICTEYQLMNVDFSDHLPVIVNFTVNII